MKMFIKMKDIMNLQMIKKQYPNTTGKEMLNDEIINNYIEHLEKDINLTKSNSFIYNTFFYEKISQWNPKNIRGISTPNKYWR